MPRPAPYLTTWKPIIEAIALSFPHYTADGEFFSEWWMSLDDGY